MSSELFSDIVDLNGIDVKEALEDGSFSYTDGNSPSAELKLVVRGALEAYPAYMAVVNYLQRTYGDETGYITMCNVPLNTIKLNKLACDFAYTAECSFQFEEDTTGNGNDGSADSRESNKRGTSPNNPSINNNGYQMPDIQASDFQYANTGGTMHLTHAYSQRSYYLSPEATGAFNYYNGIGQCNDGVYDGVDVVCPAEVFSVTVSAPYYWLNSYYRTLITGCTGCTNQYPFWGYAPECVLFKGISASPVALNYTDLNGNAVKSWYWRIRYEFEARRGIFIPPPPSVVNEEEEEEEEENNSEDSGSTEGNDNENTGNDEGDNNEGKKKEVITYSWIGSSTKDNTKTQERMDTLKTEIQGIDATITDAIFESLVTHVSLTNSLTFEEYWAILHPDGSNPPDGYKNKFYEPAVGKINEYVSLLDSYEKINRTGGIYKPGFRYIWYSEPKNLWVGNQLVARYLQANVAQVYPTFDFNRLNLPQISDAD